MQLRSGKQLAQLEKTYENFIHACFDSTSPIRLIKNLFDKSYLTSMHEFPLGWNPVCCAAYGRVKLLKCLLELGFKADYLDSRGYTPLMTSVKCGWLNCAKLLIEHGASLYTVNNEGLSIMNIERTRSRFTIVRDTIVKRRWNVIRAVVLVLAMQTRAVVTANHPARKLTRGEFEVD